MATKAKVEKRKTKKNLLLCHRCLGTIGKGVQHTCSPGLEKCNITELVTERRQKVQEQVVSSVLKNIYSVQNEEQGHAIKLATGIIGLYTLH